MIKLISILFLQCISISLFAQNDKKIDSLKKVLLLNLHDTTRCNVLDDIVETTSSDSIKTVYNNIMYAVIVKNNQKNLFFEYKMAKHIYHKTFYTNTMPFDTAINNLYKCLSIFEKNKDERMMCVVYKEISRLYFKDNDNITLAEKYSKLNLNLAQKNGYKDLEIYAYYVLGNIKFDALDYGSGFNLHMQGLAIADKEGDYKSKGFITSALARVYYELDDMQGSEKYFKLAIECAKKTDDYGTVAYCNNGLAAVYDKEKKYNLSIPLYKEAASIRKQNNQMGGYCFVMINLIDTYVDMGKLDTASFLLSDIYMQVNSVNKSKVFAFYYYTKSKYFLALKKYEQSILFGNKSLEFYNNLYGEHNPSLYKILFEANEKLGNYKKAYEYQSIYFNLKDSILNIDNKSKAIRNLLSYDYDTQKKIDSVSNANEKLIATTKLSKQKNQKLAYASLALLALTAVGFTFYQYKQKQKTNIQLADINDKINKQNNTLKTLNTELIESEEKLTTANNSKEQLISMMSHDLLNPITAITNYNQQIISKKTSNEDLLQAFKTVDAAIQPMHGLLDNMLQWTAIQKEGIAAKMKHQDVNEIVKEIISIYRPQANLKFIKINDALQDDFVLETDKSILSLILRNLLNNAIKYSANDTSILVTTNATEKTISIKDEGFGMTDEMIGYLNNKQLHKIEAKGSGLGLKLCFEFVEAVGGKIKFEKNEKDGVTINITLKA